MRGQWCKHFDCFNLETYLGMNATTAKSRNWNCPLDRSDKPVILKRDEFLMQVLDLATESDTEIELNYKSMTLKFDVSGCEYKLTSEGLKPNITAPTSTDPASNGSINVTNHT